ncbi:Acetyltransferase (GNAT) family protein [Paenibacillus sophorae]|uniref:Acetyltransferase (GNAT) family protein n=1 Tax=Paenibacillus sophorae TaxID=1333845 RepID=A0A1H8IT93_9BACL|nr:GNAT family N-acetyltransferase [Paenibacillus sophorae]QWU16078.1 GNAT family N-acetyltransferase [Paenibacillus sophorae]SEN71863.1 Acetyltransferase (GNAT) family protein [Paenibacillus sophorae]
MDSKDIAAVEESTMAMIKPLSEVSLKTVLEAWNTGFEGYYVDLSMKESAFISRMHNEDILPEQSIVLFDGERPLGLTLNGIRMVNGCKVAWNGGTAVAASYRGQGGGRLLLEESIRRYREEGVDLATLEVFVQNTPAIALYKRCGYVDKGMTRFYERLPGTKPPGDGPFEASAIEVREIDVAEAAALPFYRHRGPWQTHWLSLKGGRCLIAEREGQTAGYISFRRIYSGNGQLSVLLIYPCGVVGGCLDAETIAETLLSRLLAGIPEDAGVRAVHIPAADTFFTAPLERAGLVPAHELLYMELALTDAAPS